MAIPLAAAAAAQALQTYGPAVMEKAKSAVKAATSGRVTDVAKLPDYVGASPQRMAVMADALVRSGVRPDDIIPPDLAGTTPELKKIKDAAYALASKLQARFTAGADPTIVPAAAEQAAGDLLRVKRVQAALRVFGDEATYFLCNPNGGIPASDFAFFRSMRSALWSVR